MNAVGFANGSDGRFFEEGIQGIVSMCNCCSEVGVGALMYLLHVAAGLEVKNQDVHPERDATSFSKVEIASKGTRVTECWTWTWLVSPAPGHEKKNGTPLFETKSDLWNTVWHDTKDYYNQKYLNMNKIFNFGALKGVDVGWWWPGA